MFRTTQTRQKIKSTFEDYAADKSFFDDLFVNDGTIREYYKDIYEYFCLYSPNDIKEFNQYAKESFFNQGITFNVYSDKAKGVERIFPFDLLPRVINKKEWDFIERGVQQRNTAINMFLYDLYHEQKILKDKVVPADLLLSCSFYNKHMEGINPVGDIYVHVAGTDIIKHSDGEYYVLEDNVRCPSGVSYVLSNRETMKRTFPNMLRGHNVMSVYDYPEELLQTMQSVAPNNVDNPTCVVLTPGVFNSAYYEHSFLALWMGVQLVEGRDLFVENNYVYMRTIYGPQKVDVIYRRVDDDFIDPLVYRKDSCLGVPGLMGAYAAGNVTLLNAPGTGAADDKAVYIYLPQIIKYYLSEEPILNNVHTYRCEIPSECSYVLENMENLVVKPVDESGGYGVMIGSKSTKAERDEYKKKIKENPRKYIAQPIMKLSTHPTFIEDSEVFEPRHIDLRVFSLIGRERSYTCKGGLTRVALKKGSLIVNSSQGGGSKDTWVLEE
ncbi:MAG: circularly permuted type 2 ATP-grasp protein [Cytophagales bacterium]